MTKLVMITMACLLAVTSVFAQTKVDRQGSKSAAVVYTCPMHPEVESDKPGKCPKCGMTLVIRTQYTCPMHPEVVSNKPGKCPKCGMTLVEKKPKKDSTAKKGMNM
jgi:Cu+-exporting ATPase